MYTLPPVLKCGCCLFLVLQTTIVHLTLNQKIMHCLTFISCKPGSFLPSCFSVQFTLRQSGPIQFNPVFSRITMVLHSGSERRLFSHYSMGDIAWPFETLHFLYIYPTCSLLCLAFLFILLASSPSSVRIPLVCLLYSLSSSTLSRNCSLVQPSCSEMQIHP